LIEFEAKDLPHGIKISGFLTKTILSGSLGAAKVSKDTTYCYLNERPIDMPRKMKNLLTDMYKQYTSSATPLVIWNITA
jgi:DNA mismatch repair ATPase MutL